MITLELMTRGMCHKLYQEFENDPALYMDLSEYHSYEYSKEKADAYFDRQMREHRVLFAIMKEEEVIGEIKLKYTDDSKTECFLGIHLKNDSVKGFGYGTMAEKLAVEYAIHTLGMRAVYADVIHKNTRSQHVVEKVGFQYIGEDEKFKHYVYHED